MYLLWVIIGFLAGAIAKFFVGGPRRNAARWAAVKDLERSAVCRREAHKITQHHATTSSSLAPQWQASLGSLR